MELGVLLLQLAQLLHGGDRVLSLGQNDLIGEYRLQGGGRSLRLKAQALPGGGGAQPCDRHHGPRRGRVHRLEFQAGVYPQLVGLVAPAGAIQHGFHLEAAAGDLHPGQPVVLSVPGDLEDTGAELLPVHWPGGILLQAPEEVLHPLQLQGGAEPAGEELPLGDEGGEGSVGNAPRLQIVLQQGLVAQSGLLTESLFVPHIHAALIQLALQLPQQSGPVRPCQVHLVHKEEGGYPVSLQQLPQGMGVTLDPVGSADHQNGAVQHRQGALHLGGEVHVAGGVQQGDLQMLQREHRLLGEDGDAPLLLHRVGVQKGVPVVHPAQLFQFSAGVEQSLAEGGLARVHMGQNAHD